MSAQGARAAAPSLGWVARGPIPSQCPRATHIRQRTSRTPGRSQPTPLRRASVARTCGVMGWSSGCSPPAYPAVGDGLGPTILLSLCGTSTRAYATFSFLRQGARRTVSVCALDRRLGNRVTLLFGHRCASRSSGVMRLRRSSMAKGAGSNSSDSNRNCVATPRRVPTIRTAIWLGSISGRNSPRSCPSRT